MHTPLHPGAPHRMHKPHLAQPPNCKGWTRRTAPDGSRSCKHTNLGVANRHCSLRCARAALALERSRKGSAELPGVVLADWSTDPVVDDEFLEFDYPKKVEFRVWARAASELANEGRARNSTNWQDVAFTVVK